MLVGMSEAAAGRRPWTRHMTARRLVWFLGTAPARQFRARRAGGRLNRPWSVCCTSQLPGETLVRAAALGPGTWEETAGAERRCWQDVAFPRVTLPWSHVHLQVA